MPQVTSGACGPRSQVQHYRRRRSRKRRDRCNRGTALRCGRADVHAGRKTPVEPRRTCKYKYISKDSRDASRKAAPTIRLIVLCALPWLRGQARAIRPFTYANAAVKPRIGNEKSMAQGLPPNALSLPPFPRAQKNSRRRQVAGGRRNVPNLRKCAELSLDDHSCRCLPQSIAHQSTPAESAGKNTDGQKWKIISIKV